MILHICTPEKFIQPFIEFIDENFDAKLHHFAIIGRQENKYNIQTLNNIKFIKKPIHMFNLLYSMYHADKIILHGLWSPRVNQLLVINPWLLKKCYWVMWGGDFYSPDKQDWIKKQVIKKVGNLVTYIKGDYELAQQWYGAHGKYHECFMYPSNLFKKYDIQSKTHNTINIQIGNSADPSNNHIEILNKLLKFKDDNIKIFVPLSYGDQQYAKEVIAKGRKIFGDKFIPLRDFMPFEKYLDFLADIDIAVFAHGRQQAMGNIITLLGIGTKVYINSGTVQWAFFHQHNIHVFNKDKLTISPLEPAIKTNNQQIVERLFSKQTLYTSLKEVFNG